MGVRPDWLSQAQGWVVSASRAFLKGVRLADLWREIKLNDLWLTYSSTVGLRFIIV